MEIYKRIQASKQEFERSFLEAEYYKKQTVDEEHLELLLNMVQPAEGENVLDLGTGTGYIAFPLAERYPKVRVIGLDIVTNTLQRNREKAETKGLKNLEFLCYDGISFPMGDHEVDAVITRYALHHFPNLTACFCEMKRILKPGGRLIISDPTPNANDTERFVDKYMQKKPDGHLKFYTLEEYKDMLKQAGFSFCSNQTTTIRFPRRDAGSYRDILNEAEQDVLDGYNIQVVEDEIWITEKVLNIQFRI